MEDNSSNHLRGHTLGGTGNVASADEIRQRRLATLGGGGPEGGGGDSSGGDTKAATTPPTRAGTTTTFNGRHNEGAGSTTSNTTGTEKMSIAHRQSDAVAQSNDTEQTWLVEHEADDDDMELQKALAMSLGNVSDEPVQADIRSQVPVDLVSVNRLSEQTSVIAAGSSVEETNGHECSPAIIEEWWKTGDDFDISQFHAFMWDTGLTTDNDKSRWVGQGIDFRDEAHGSSAQVPNGIEDGNTMLSLLSKDHGPWGLVQSHGGPCGVLAAVQAELLRILLFGRRDPLDFPPPLQPGAVPAQSTAELSTDLVREALARAIAIILARSAITLSAAAKEDNERKTVGIVLPSRSTDSSTLTWDDLEPWDAPADVSTKSNFLSVFTVSPRDPTASNPLAHKRQRINEGHESREKKIERLARAVTAFLLSEGPPGRIAPLESFRRPGGVMLLVMSLVNTRGRDVIQGEMDDPSGTKLTSQFGHCGQELINLLLTGQAVSNVFDNTLKPSGELTCRGIQHRPNVGYLSQLEALRYCEVGGYYKTPVFPIWVVGSTSHFTVLFGDATCLKESESDQLLEKCKRAFKAVEGGEENGFISSQSLEAVLKSLGVYLGGDHHYSTLAASLEVSDAGIILWNDFWKATSRLMTGASIEQVLNDRLHPGGMTNGGSVGGGPPLLLTQNGEPNSDTKPSAKSPNYVESDEELAKRLSQQWELENTGASTSAATAPAAAARVDSPMEVELPPISDEELARKLQAEWDAEASGTGASSSVVAVNGSQGSPSWSNVPDTNSSVATPEITPMSTVSDSHTQDTKESAGGKLDFEKYGDSFLLYHYNGLRGGTLTPFRVTRLSAEEAVGASIALNRGNGSHSAGSGDLEDVVRTKWPSCMINWLGRTPPYID